MKGGMMGGLVVDEAPAESKTDGGNSSG